MEQKTHSEVYDGVVVAESPLLGRKCSSRYGSVPGLDDEELIDPAEAERLFLKREFAPILALPVKAKKGGIKPNIDEDGTVEWGAFGTVDFDKYVEFDKLRYKADKLREELFSDRIMLEIISERIKDKNKYAIIERVYKGTLDLGDIADFDIFLLAQRYLWAKRKQCEIIELEEKSRKRRQEKARKFLGS